MRVFNSIYSLPYPTRAQRPGALVVANNTLVFNANPLNSFLPQVREAMVLAVEDLMSAAVDAAQEDFSMSRGDAAKKKMVIAVVICTIVPVLAVAYIAYGVPLRLQRSSTSFRTFLTMTIVCYGIFCASCISTANVGIDSVQQQTSFTPASAQKLSTQLQIVGSASQFLQKAIDVSHLVQPNFTTIAHEAVALQNLLNFTISMSRAGFVLDANEAAQFSPVLGFLNGIFVNASLIARNEEALRSEMYSGVTFPITEEIIGENESSASFPHLPTCNMTRLVAMQNDILDSMAQLFLIEQFVTLNNSIATVRSYSYSVESAREVACTDPTCPQNLTQCIPATPYGLLQNTGVDSSPILNLVTTTGLGTITTAWMNATTALGTYVSVVQQSLQSTLEIDTYAMLKSRRLIVWLTVFAALLLQVVLFALWKAIFSGTIDSELLP
jgi:hypothetical protein